MFGKRPMQTLRVPRKLAETTIEILDKVVRVDVGLLDRIDATQTKLPYKAILERLIGTTFKSRIRYIMELT